MGDRLLNNVCIWAFNFFNKAPRSPLVRAARRVAPFSAVLHLVSEPSVQRSTCDTGLIPFNNRTACGPTIRQLFIRNATSPESASDPLRILAEYSRPSYLRSDLISRQWGVFRCLRSRSGAVGDRRGGTSALPPPPGR